MVRLPLSLKRLGPGLVTGAADDDPSGIATYSQAGVQAGFATLWTLFLTTPLMIAVQTISARVGHHSEAGIIANLRRRHPFGLLAFLVALLTAANAFNIAADIAAMGAAARLVTGFGRGLWTAGFALLTLALMAFMPFERYARLLRGLTLVLLAYVATLFVIRVPWGEALRALVVPEISWTKDYLLLIVAVLGTTISPYMFFWQAGQEAEAARAGPTGTGPTPARVAAANNRIRTDTVVGMVASNVVAAAITITAAVTLKGRIPEITSAAQAAEALRPVAGELAFALFAAGIIGTGLLAVPVLAGSTAFAIADLFGWRGGLSDTPRTARRFYGALAAVMALGVALDTLHLDPMKLLFWSAVANGVVAVPMMAMLMRLTHDRQAVGDPLPSRYTRVVGWLATALMGAAVLAWAVASIF